MPRELLWTRAIDFCSVHSPSSWSLSHGHHNVQVVEAGGVPLILALMRMAQVPSQHRESLVATLQSISVEGGHCRSIFEHGGVEALLTLMSSPDRTPVTIEYAVGTLRNMGSDAAVLEAVVACEGVAHMAQVCEGRSAAG